MSAPRISDGMAPRQRTGMRGRRRRLNLEFRPGVFAQLERLQRHDRSESYIETIERLITSAHDELYKAA